MLNTGILNPRLLELLARIRHTNALVIADRGFPFWPQIETVDISLVDDVPTVIQVIKAVRANGTYTQAYMAKEFKVNNFKKTQEDYQRAFKRIPVKFEAHEDLKKRVPGAIGLIRTGDTTQYGNVILISG